MNYEKKYLEALEKARQFSEHPLQEDSSSIVEYIFPELADSEDEKIIKELITHCRNTRCVTEEGAERIAKWIAWLEKQGKRDSRYENLEELLEADTIYQMAMNDAMVEEAKTKAMNALSELEIGKLLEIGKQGELKETLCDKCKKEQPSHSCQDITSLGRCALEKQGEQKPFDYENANIQQNDFVPKAATANRQLYNRAILAILSNYVEKYPDIRFGQMLCNLGIGPVFNEESQEIYLKLNETINKKS